VKQSTKILEIDGTSYQIGRFRLELASYILGRLFRAIPRTADTAAETAPREPQGKPAADDIARAMIGAGLFGDMDRATRAEIQNECMRVCSRMENDLPVPLSNGKDLIVDDLGLVLRLEMETLVFNLTPFFNSGGMKVLEPQASNSRKT
jgi:hypothetical protein